jgi:tetratricopeptide (TPR) repeat protein
MTMLPLIPLPLIPGTMLMWILLLQPQGADADLRAGIKAYQSGQLDNAIARLQKAYAAAPQNSQVRLYLGLFLYEKSSESLEAQKLMASVVDEFPDNGDLQLRLLDSYMRTGNRSLADGLLERFRKKMSSDPRFAFNVVYTLLHHRQFSGAKEQIGRISRELQGEVSFIGALIELGSGQPEEGHKLLQNATRLGFPPPHTRQALTAAESYMRLRDLPAAARAYEAYLKHNPDAAPARFQLGVCYYGYGDFNRALEQMLSVKKQAPQLPEVDLYAGSILIEMKRTEEAKPHLEAELEKNPASFKAMAKLAYLEYLAGRDVECRSRLDSALKLDSEWFETHMVYGLLYNRLGEHQAAVRSLEACLKSEPEYPKAHFQLSLAYRRLGNDEKAQEHLAAFERLQKAAVDLSQEALGLKDKK